MGGFPQCPIFHESKRTFLLPSLHFTTVCTILHLNTIHLRLQLPETGEETTPAALTLFRQSQNAWGLTQPKGIPPPTPPVLLLSLSSPLSAARTMGAPASLLCESGLSSAWSNVTFERLLNSLLFSTHFSNVNNKIEFQGAQRILKQSFIFQWGFDGIQNGSAFPWRVLVV